MHTLHLKFFYLFTILCEFMFSIFWQFMEMFALDISFMPYGYSSLFSNDIQTLFNWLPTFYCQIMTNKVSSFYWPGAEICKTELTENKFGTTNDTNFFAAWHSRCNSMTHFSPMVWRSLSIEKSLTPSWVITFESLSEAWWWLFQDFSPPPSSSLLGSTSY